MTEAVTIAFALGLGYLVTVGSALTLTFGLASAAPGFVAREGRIAGRYLVVYGAMWTLCAMAGGYVAAMLSGTMIPWLIGGALTVGLGAVLWSNIDDRKRHGVAQQILMSLLSGAGMAAGFWLRLRG